MSVWNVAATGAVFAAVLFTWQPANAQVSARSFSDALAPLSAFEEASEIDNSALMDALIAFQNTMAGQLSEEDYASRLFQNAATLLQARNDQLRIEPAVSELREQVFRYLHATGDAYIRELSDELHSALDENGNRVLSPATLTSLDTLRGDIFDYQRADVQDFFADLAMVLQETIALHGERPYTVATREDVISIASAVFAYHAADRHVYLETLATELAASLASERGTLPNDVQAALINLIAEIEGDAADRPEFIRSTAARLNAEMVEHNGVNGAYPHAVLVELSALATLIEEREILFSPYAVGAFATRLNQQINPAGTDAAAAAAADAAVAVSLPQLATLRTSLLAIEQEYFRAALARRTADLRIMLEVEPADREPLTSQDLRNLDALRRQIDDLLGDGRQHGIHIISAQFGHVAGDRSGGRCDVAATMREACQSRGTCDLDDALFAGLCGGEDPAPFERSSERGVLIQYNCLAATRSEWNHILVRPSVSYAEPTLTTILRSPADNIMCQPAPRPTMGGDDQ